MVTTAKYILPRLLGPFCQRFPEVEVSLHVGNRGHVLERYHNGADDLYLFSHPPAGQHTLAGRFLANPLVLIAPEGHWAVGRRGLTFEHLRDERFLFREPGSATRLVFETWLRDNSMQLSRIMQVESNEVIRMGVESGLGLAVLSEHTISAGSENLAVLDVPGFPLGSHWYLVCHGNRRLPAVARQFVRYMDGHMAECIEQRYIRNELGPILRHVAKQG